MLIRKQLFAQENAPPNTRVNPETGAVETSFDGGETWQPNPDADPRINPGFQAPPPDVPDPRCAASAGMVQNVRNVVEGAAGGTTAAGIASILLTLLLIPGIGWMFGAMLLFATSFLTATAAAVLAAFTEDVYEVLLCMFYDNVESDGKITEAGLNDVVDACAEFSDPLVQEVMGWIRDMHGFVGFTNAGVAYADEEAECNCLVLDLVPSTVDPAPGTTIINLGGGYWRIEGYDNGSDNRAGFKDANGYCINIDIVVSTNNVFWSRYNCAMAFATGMSPLATGNYNYFCGTRDRFTQVVMVFHAFATLS